MAKVGITGTSTVLGPALLVAGVMIAAGTNQVLHSTKMIDSFSEEMANMTVKFDEVNKELINNKGEGDADLGNEITNAFHKCCKCNDAFANSLRESLVQFDGTRKTYN